MANFWEGIAPTQASTPQMGNNGGGFNIQELMKFASQMKGKNPEQMVYNYMQQNGIGKDQLNEVMGMAKQIEPMVKGLFGGK